MQPYKTQNEPFFEKELSKQFSLLQTPEIFEVLDQPNYALKSLRALNVYNVQYRLSMNFSYLHSVLDLHHCLHRCGSVEK